MELLKQELKLQTEDSYDIFVKCGTQWITHSLNRCIIGGCIYTGPKEHRLAMSLTDAFTFVDINADKSISIVFEKKLKKGGIN